MTKLKRMGIIVIIAGAFIPSVLYPFTTLTRSATVLQIALGSRGGVYQPRLNDLEIVLKKGTWIKDGTYQGHYEGRITISYHYIIAGGITIVFLGIGLIALARKKTKKDYD